MSAYDDSLNDFEDVLPPLPDDMDDEVPEELSPEMIKIPAGWCIMGTSDKMVIRLWEDEDWAREWREKGLFRIEQPQCKVFVKDFEIAKYPMTNIMYSTFIWESNHRVPKGWIGFRYPEGMENHPVVGISCKDALEYCDWLSKMTGRKYRLPTEAEWEKAATGGRPRIYPWGETFDPWRCNTLESGKNGTTPIGFYSPAGDSVYGVADMSGNVWEWTNDRFLSYPYGEIQPGSEKENRMTLRGGAWYYSHKLARCASREGQPADYVSPSVGFRLVRDIE